MRSLNISLRLLLVILGIFSTILLIINFSRSVIGSSNVSFSSFLNFLSSIDIFQITINISDFTIPGNWGIIDGLRLFLNVFAQAIGVVVYLCANLINLIIYCAQFIRFLFVA